MSTIMENSNNDDMNIESPSETIVTVAASGETLAAEIAPAATDFEHSDIAEITATDSNKKLGVTISMGKYSLQQTVNCGPFGTGIIKEFRDIESDRIYSVELNNWKLATGISPILYVTETTLSANEANKIKQLRIAKEKQIAAEILKKEKIFTECFTKSVVARNEASELFKKSEIAAARDGYLKSLNILKMLSSDLTPEQRARVIEQNILCHNNMAICSNRLEKFVDSIESAKSALLIVTALESAVPNGEVWAACQAQGITLDKVRKDWKKKSLFALGKAELGRHNPTEAEEYLEAALQLIKDDQLLAAGVKELKVLLSKAKQQKAIEAKREMSTWAKAFRKNEMEPEDDVTPQPSPTRPNKDNKKLDTLPSDKSPTPTNVVSTTNHWKWSSTSIWLGLGLVAATSVSLFLLRKRFK